MHDNDGNGGMESLFDFCLLTAID